MHLLKFSKQITGSYFISLNKFLWSSRFETWAMPLSDTEDGKCENALSVIRKAIDGHSELTGLNLSVYIQGSYAANTNVRTDSDIDLCIKCTNTFHYSLPEGAQAAELYISPATLLYSDYKNKIGRVLVDRFGAVGAQRGDKAFRVHANTYRIDADVVPTFEYRRYFRTASGLDFLSGTCFYSDAGKFIVNWPEQTLANGRTKNTKTGSRYKKVIRVLKGLKNEMIEKGYDSAKEISSFQIACAVYNVPENLFNNGDLYDDVKGVANYIWYVLYTKLEKAQTIDWKEIDEIHIMFPTDQYSKALAVKEFFWSVKSFVNFDK